MPDTRAGGQMVAHWDCQKERTDGVVWGGKGRMQADVF